MKKVLPLILVMILGAGVFAQGIQPINAELNPDIRIPNKANLLQNGARTATCGPDTLLYGFFKTLLSDTAFQALPASSGGVVSGFGQLLEVPFTPVTITGFTFYAWNIDNTGGTHSVTCSVFDVDANGLPSGAALATTTITIDTVFGNGLFSALQRNVTFPTPITVGTDVVFTVESNSDSTLAFVGNDWETNDGQGESLAALKFNGNWVQSESLNIGGNPLDMDITINPIVTYDITSSFAANPADCFPQNQAIAFTNNSTPVITSRMFNLTSFFAHFDQTPDSSYFWDFGDGNSSYDINPSHTYTDGATSYDVDLFSLVIGYSVFCVDSVKTTFNAGAEADASFTVGSQTGGAVAFIDSSPTADSWAWDFGDGNTSTMQNPSHTYTASGVYTVTLIVTSCGDTDTATTEISVILTDIQDDLLDEALSVFPNPSTGSFNVELSLNKAENVSVIVMNAIGQQVSVTELGRTLNVNRQINLSGMEKGIYLLQVKVGDRQVVRRISLL